MSDQDYSPILPPNAKAGISADIEITPEMIAAGAQILENQFDASPSLAEYVAREFLEQALREMRVSPAKSSTPDCQAPRSRQ